MDKTTTELYRDFRIDNRKGEPTRYQPPPGKLRMYVAAALLPLNGAEKAVLVCLIDHANTKTGRCDPSEPTIAHELDVPLRTVERAIAGLRTAGIVNLLRRGRAGKGGRASNAYHLNWQALLQRYQQYEAARKSKPANLGGKPPSNVAGKSPSNVAT